MLLVTLVAYSLVMDARNQANVQMEDGFARHVDTIFAQAAEVLKLFQTVRVDIFWFGQLMLQSIQEECSHVMDAGHPRNATMEDGTVVIVALTSVLTADLNNSPFNLLPFG